MAGFVHSVTRHGQLTIVGNTGSISLMGPALRVRNLPTLFSRTARGDSRVIPNAAGRSSRRRRRDERVWQLELIVRGDVNLEGAVVANPYSTLDSHMIYLDQNIVKPPTTQDGHAATLTLRTQSTRTANVFIQNWEVVPDPSFAARNFVTFDLVSPSGEFSA